MTYEDSLRLAGEILSVLGAILILLLEVSPAAPHKVVNTDEGVNAAISD